MFVTLLDFVLIISSSSLIIWFYLVNKIKKRHLFFFFFYLFSFFLLKVNYKYLLEVELVNSFINSENLKTLIDFFWIRFFIGIFFLAVLKFLFDTEWIKNKLRNNFFFLLWEENNRVYDVISSSSSLFVSYLLKYDTFIIIFYFCLYQTAPFIEEYGWLPFSSYYLDFLVYSGIPFFFTIVNARLILFFKFYSYKKKNPFKNLQPSRSGSRFFSTKVFTSAVDFCYLCHKVIKPVATIVVGAEVVFKLSQGSLNSVPPWRQYVLNKEFPDDPHPGQWTESKAAYSFHLRSMGRPHSEAYEYYTLKESLLHDSKSNDLEERVKFLEEQNKFLKEQNEFFKEQNKLTFKS